jgi:hypothetical protein
MSADGTEALLHMKKAGPFLSLRRGEVRRLRHAERGYRQWCGMRDHQILREFPRDFAKAHWRWVIGRACIYLNVSKIAAKARDVDCSQIFQLWLN